MRGSKSFLAGLVAAIAVMGVAGAHASDKAVRTQIHRPFPGLAQFTEKLIASDADDGDRFGSLNTGEGLHGDTAVIGAYEDDHAAGLDAGSAYVFSRSGDSWNEVQKLVASDAESGDYFGLFTAVTDDFIFVSAILDDHSGFSDAGSVYVFTRSGDQWTEHQKLTSSDAFQNEQFGWWLDASENTLITATWNGERVFVYSRVGDSWIENQILTSSDGEAGDKFGYSLDLQGDTLIVGAGWDEHPGMPYSGSAYVFTSSGGVWTEQQKLVASDVDDNTVFGADVGLVDNTLMVSAPYDNHPGMLDTGAVYVFRRTGGIWTELQKLTPSDPEDSALFGTWIAFNDQMALVSSLFDDHSGLTDVGSVYVFSREGEVWTERGKLVAPDGSSDDAFGIGVELDADWVIVGCESDDHSGFTDAGSAYVFRIPIFTDGFESGDTRAWSHSVP
jgi:hypothetical protein